MNDSQTPWSPTVFRINSNPLPWPSRPLLIQSMPSVISCCSPAGPLLFYTWVSALALPLNCDGWFSLIWGLHLRCTPLLPRTFPWPLLSEMHTFPLHAPTYLLPSWCLAFINGQHLLICLSSASQYTDYISSRELWSFLFIIKSQDWNIMWHIVNA